MLVPGIICCMNNLRVLSNMLIALILSMALLVSGCTSSTSYGECVGLFDKSSAEKMHPDLIYKLSGWNCFVAIFVGPPLLFLPTIFVIKDETFCPEGKIVTLVEPKPLIEIPENPIRLN